MGITRRFAAWVGAVALLLGGVSWAAVGCMRDTGGMTRTVTAEEAGRLAGLRAKNLAAGTVAILITMPDDLGGTSASGWVDWTRPLVFAGLKPANAPTYTGLVQAIPGLVATRPGDTAPAADDVPPDGWSIRRAFDPTTSNRVDPLGQALDIVLSAVMVLTSPQPDDAAALRERALWLDDGTIDGVPVDVFRSPLVPPGATAPGASPTASPPAAQDGTPEAVFHVDDRGRLRRLQVNPGGHGLATVDFLVDQPPPDPARIPAIDVLGGAPVAPRPVTDAEADLLASMRRRNAGTAAAVDLTVPVADGEILHARGWIDWRRPLAYLDLDYPGTDRDGTMFVRTGGIAFRPAEPTGDRPPIPAPQDGWRTQTWADRTGGDQGADDVDVLLYKLMSMAAPQPDDPEVVKESATWLREGRLGGTDTTTFELPMQGDRTAPRGHAPFRYWLDDEGTLRRVEMRTRRYGLAHADLTPQDPGWITVPPAVLNGLG